MKTILTIGLTLFTLTISTTSFAGYSDEQLRYERKCSVEECKGNDHGRMYAVTCENTIFNGMNVTGGTNVMWKAIRGNGRCYCPCTLGFWGEMQK